MRDLTPKETRMDLKGVDEIEFTIFGEQFWAVKPTAKVAEIFLGSVSRSSPLKDMVDAAIDFLSEVVLDEEGEQDQEFFDLVQRQIDEADDFGPSAWIEIATGLIEEFTGRPKGKSSGSGRRQKRVGASSTGSSSRRVSATRRVSSSDTTSTSSTE